MPNTVILDNIMATLKNRVSFQPGSLGTYQSTVVSNGKEKYYTIIVFCIFTRHKYILSNILYIVTVNNPKPS